MTPASPAVASPAVATPTVATPTVVIPTVATPTGLRVTATVAKTEDFLDLHFYSLAFPGHSGGTASREVCTTRCSRGSSTVLVVVLLRRVHPGECHSCVPALASATGQHEWPAVWPRRPGRPAVARAAAVYRRCRADGHSSPHRRTRGRAEGPARRMWRADRCIEAVRAGESRALVVRGEPGVGKTALLGYVVEHASGCRVVRAAGVQSEMELAFAGLHQLLAPMLDRLERLPVPQRDALGTAFGLSPGSAPDRFVVGLAVLGLLSEVAEERPLVCVVDDAQWLDRTSAQVLGFVARRLEAESVGLVFAARGPSEDVAGLPVLVVEGLREGDAGALLDSVLTGPLDARVRDLIVSETRGNPLALLELVRGLTPAELAGGFGLLGGVPLSRSIEESFRRRLDALPPETGACCSSRSRSRRRAAAGAAGSPAARNRGSGRDAGSPGGPARVGGASAVSASAGALGGLPVGVASGETGRTPRAGGGHRSGGRSRPPRLAPSPRHAGARRGRRRGARALAAARAKRDAGALDPEGRDMGPGTWTTPVV
jgi:hypothetical protein